MYDVIDKVQTEDQVVTVDAASAAPIAATLHESFGDNFAYDYIPNNFAEHIRAELAKFRSLR